MKKHSIRDAGRKAFGCIGLAGAVTFGCLGGIVSGIKTGHKNAKAAK